MKIILKKDWDVDISAPLVDKTVKGHFVGRQKETELLSNEIVRRNSGSILISGHRGVGKTSLVYKVIWNARDKDKDKKFIPILLNASQLEPHLKHIEDQGKVSIDPKEIIENLIRRLYSATINLKDIDESIIEKIKELYKKTVAQDFKLFESYQKYQDVSKEITKEKEAEILFNENNFKHIIIFTSFVIAVFLQFLNISAITTIFSEKLITELLIPIKKALALLFALPIPYVINLRYKKHIKEKQKEESIEKAEKLYSFDNSIGNLEFDLEQIHREFKNAKNKKKLVYVIDEMDKLNTDQIENVLKFFKNLFTLSDAIFIFIGGEALYNIGLITKETADNKEKTNPQKESEYRAKEYTYFTSRYFLSSPSWNDLSNFYNEIIHDKELSDNEFEILKHAIAFDSKNDFFDLKTFIKDRIAKFNEGHAPIIDKLSDGDEQKSRFHKAIITLFEGKYISLNQSKWKENELLLRKLFQHAHQIYSSYSGYQIADPQGDNIEDEAIRYFNGFLWRLEVLNQQSETQQTIKGQPIPIRTYQYTGSFPSEPPQKLEELTEFEKGFKIKFENYINYILTLHNAQNTVDEKKEKKEITIDDFWRDSNQFVQDINDCGFDALSQFNTNNPIYQNMVNVKPPYPYRREEIETQTNKIFSHTNSMLQNSPQIISNIIIFLNKNLNLQKQNMQNNGNLFSGAANQIRNALINTNHLVVFKPDLSRQILLIYDTIDMIKSISKNIDENASTHRVICFSDHYEDLQFEGLHLVNMEDPSQMKETLIAMFLEVNRFFQE